MGVLTFSIAHGLVGKDLVYQQGCAICHTLRTTTGAKPATLAGFGRIPYRICIVLDPCRQMVMDRKSGFWNESAFWKMVAGAISLVLLVCVILNLRVPAAVPAQLTSFLFGCLASVAAGYTVVSPRSSALSLSTDGENKYRRSQYVVGMTLSLLLALAFLLTELRAVPSSWVLVPVIFLTPVLLLRHLVINSLPGREKTAMHGRHQVEKDQDESD